MFERERWLPKATTFPDLQMATMCEVPLDSRHSAD